MGQFAAPVCWGIAIIVFIFMESLSPQLVSIWFAAGALAAAVFSLFSDNLLMQLLVFFAVSAICLLITRPLASKVVEVKKIPTNADRLIGKTATVTEDIDPITGKGRVVVTGDSWSAVTPDDTALTKGSTVQILKIDGVKLVVEPIKEN